MIPWQLRSMGAGFVVICVVAAAGEMQSRAANLIHDPHFEHTNPAGMWSATSGTWMGGISASAGLTPNITPHVGSRMLQFLQTHPLDNELGLHDSCDVHQIIDLHSLAVEIDAGELLVESGAFFNRVSAPLDVESMIDRRFDLSLRTFAGLPLTELLWRRDGSPVATGPLSTVSLVSDGNERTWESLDLVVPLPPLTRWVVLTLSAVEDVRNDHEAPEFTGHYADAAWLRVIPEPDCAVVGIGVCAMLTRRRG